MNPNRLILIVCLAGCAWLSPVMALAAPSKNSPLPAEVLHPVEEKNLKESFRTWIARPGNEHFAVQLILNNPQSCLQSLQQLAKSKPLAANPQVSLFTAEAFRALEKPKVALTWYRQYLKHSGKNPPGYYPVELPEVDQQETVCFRCSSESRWLPFVCGPGSFRDNLVLRRLIELKAWKEAELEFARIWKHHHTLVGNRAFPGQSLQFVLDYAWFLHTRNLLDQELKVLLTPVSRLDFDHNPIWQYQRSRLVQPVAPGASPQPNKQPPPALFESRCGVTQREFFRLLLEQIQQLKQIPALEQRLDHDLKLGNPRVLLLLAELRSAQEQPEAALKLELDYLKTLTLDQPSRLFREALVFEQYGELKSAIERYSALPGITEVTITLPDILELDSSVWITKLYRPTFVKNQFQLPKSQLTDHIATLYLMQGDVKKSSTALFQKQTQPTVSASVEELLQLRERALATSSQTEFEAVERAGLSRLSLDQQANYAWAIGNWSEAITIQSQYLRQVNLPQNWRVPQNWEKQITQLDPALQIKCYELLIEQFPKNAFLRLELLHLKNQLQSEAAIPYLEQLLDETRYPFPYSPTKAKTGFGTYPEVIHTLMSHYVAHCQKEKIFNFSLRLARCDQPFKNVVQAYLSDKHSRFENSPMWIETHKVLSLAFDHIASQEQLQILADALQSSPWTDAKTQIAGYLTPSPSSPPSPEFQAQFPVAKKMPGWANLPPGVNLITGMETIFDLCRDETRIYVGHPWGVSIFDFQGNFITRVAIQAPAEHLAVASGALWIGTPYGVLRMDCKTYLLNQLPLKVALPTSSASVYGLATQGNLVWIGTEEAIWQYNFQTGKLRFFLNDELGARATGRWDSFWFEKEFVWVTSTLNPAAGLFRFSTATEQWVRFQAEPVELSQVIGLLDGKLWVMFFTPTQYQLPGYINSQTMELIRVPLQGGGQLPFVDFIGCDQNQPVFSRHSHSAYRFDPATHQLKPFSQSVNQIELDIPCGLRGDTIQIQSNGVVTGKSASPWTRCDVFGRPFSGAQWRLLTLPNRTQVVGAWPGESILFGKTPGSDQQYLTHFPTSSGLRFRFPNGETRLQTLPESQENVLGDTIFSLSIDQENQAAWACTNYGVSILDRNFEVLKTLTHREGMVSDQVVDGIQQGNNWFFRHSLILPECTTQFDLKTGHLTAKPSRLPQMGLTPNDPQKIISFVELPFLGGPVFGQTLFRQKCCLYGSRGLVVLDRTSVLCQPKYNLLQIQMLPNQPMVNQSALKLAALPKIQTLDDLRPQLQTTNPLLLAQLLYSLQSSQLLSQPDLISLLTPFLHHPHRRVRGTTLFILQNIGTPVVMDAIKQLINDSDEGIRAVTALELAKQNAPLELNRYELILFGPPKQFAVGADQLVPISPKMVYEALIPHLSPDILQLFLRYPCPVSSEMPVSLFQAIAKAVTNNPPLLELLLDPPPSIWTPRPGSFDQAKKNLFVDDVFRFVSTEAIPTVQAARQSSDPRKQERLGDILKLLGTQEIPKDRLHSPGQSRGFRFPTVQEILAENSYFSVKPSELGQHTPSSEAYDRLNQFENNLASLPVATQVHQLTRLFIQSQQMVFTPSNHQYQNWGSFGAIGEAWPESPQPFPFKHLDTDVLQARIINKINEFPPDARQYFFQYLLIARQNDHRLLAIHQLAEALDEPTKARNRRLLKNLLSDSEIKIVIAATVSLVRLDDPTGRTLVASWMKGDSLKYKQLILNELNQVTDDSKFGFLRDQLSQCATDPTLPAETQAQAKTLVDRIRNSTH